MVHMGFSLHRLPAFPYDRLRAEGLKTSGRPQPCWAGRALPVVKGKEVCGRCSLPCRVASRRSVVHLQVAWMPSLWAAMPLGVREEHFLSVGVLVEVLLVRD